MRQSLAIAIAFVCSGGCSLIYNPSNLGQPVDAKQFLDAESIDAPIDAAPVLDADPTMLVIDDVFPKTIYAGQGSNGSFPVTLAIHGHNIVDGFQLTITPAGQVHVIGTPVHSADRNWIAAQIEIDVGSAGSATPLTIAVSEVDDSHGDMKTSTLTGVLQLDNPPSLVGSGSAALNVNLSTLLSTTYQVIDATNLTFNDDSGSNAPIYLRAYSSITLGTINEKGGTGTSGGAAGTAGQGGCVGGTADQNGQCTQGGGNGASSNTTYGGGGGGFADMGIAGVQSIMGGNPHGSADLVNLGIDQQHDGINQSSGGGGGGLSAAIGGSAGTGGGGGGTVIVEAGGAITVTSIDVSGGAGGAGTAGFLLGGGGGGGGGGTGGVIIVRSASTVTGSLAANGGASGAGGGTGNTGGAGSVGRIRVDTSGTPPSAAIPIHRGPAFAASTPTFTSDINQVVTLLGQANDTISLYDVDGSGNIHTGEPTNEVFDNFGSASPKLSLLDGYNRICATLDNGIAGTDLADTCFEIVYLP
jgi:hypothetical protein